MIELIFENINITKGTFKIEQINTNTDDESREYAELHAILWFNKIKCDNEI